jgi:hypothetical protein
LAAGVVADADAAGDAEDAALGVEAPSRGAINT